MAFFLESTFVGLFFFGWDRLSKQGHLAVTWLVAIGSNLSALWILVANGWMQNPVGAEFNYFTMRMEMTDFWAVAFNPDAQAKFVHTVSAGYVTGAMFVLSISSWYLLRGRDIEFAKRSFRIAAAFGLASVASVIVLGDESGYTVGEAQQTKLAAMEAHYRTQTGAPLLIGGIPYDESRTTRYAIRIPGGLSLLLDDNLNARVIGLEEFPQRDWPNVRIVHWCFDIMVGTGFMMLALAVWSGLIWLRHRTLADHPWLLRALVAAGPLGFVAIETGWIVTEVGRQPWIIYGVMRTEDAVTAMPLIVVPFTTFTALYVFLAVIVVYLLRRQFMETQETVFKPLPGSHV